MKVKPYRFLSLLPYWIQTIPYHIGLIAVKIFYWRFPVNIWSRNSLRLKNIVCALSDLDLTFYFHGDFNPFKVVKRYSKLKKIIPFLGEINLYSYTDATDFIPFINRYEFLRDPHLLNLHSTKLRQKDIYQKIVFLCKNLEADQNNLRTIPDYRIKKWNHHLSLLNIKFPHPLSFDNLIEVLITELNSIEIDAGNFIRNLFSVDSRIHKNLEVPYGKIENKRNFILIYPFRWIGISYCHENLKHDLKSIGRLSTHESELLQEQIRWEIWGLYTQSKLDPRPTNLLIHLNLIRDLLEMVDLPEKDSLMSGINVLIKNRENFSFNDLLTYKA
ncbi:MAG: hypothetical protein KAQ98_06995 [Bacteriovoracaceae bacterium]|nr:hypothetical protein [Bacteriovoracaceae bacterium]